MPDPLLSQFVPEASALIAAVGRPALVIVSSSSGGAVTPGLAALLGTIHSDDLVLQSEPEGTNWTAAEVREQIVAPLQRGSAAGHQHLLIEEADRMRSTTADKLLKVLEESQADTTVWLCHHDDSSLPAALRGRAAHAVHLAPSTPEQRQTALSAQHPDSPAAEIAEALKHCHGDLLLADVALRFGLQGQLADTATSYYSSTPFSLANQLAISIAHLGVALHHKTKRTPAAPVNAKGNLPTLEFAKLKPEARASSRRLFETILRNWIAEVSYDLASRPFDPALDRELILRELLRVRSTTAFHPALTTLLASALGAQESAKRHPNPEEPHTPAFF